DELEDCLNDILNTKVIAFDLETQGLSPFDRDKDIVVLALATKRKQWIIPVNHSESPFKSYNSRKKMLQLLELALKDKTLIAHNGKFDSLWLLVKYGIDLTVKYDTMLASHLLDENTPNGLKYLASLHF